MCKSSRKRLHDMEEELALARMELAKRDKQKELRKRRGRSRDVSAVDRERAHGDEGDDSE